MSLVSLTIAKGMHAGQPVRVNLWLTVDGVGEGFVELNAEQFTQLLGGSVLKCDVDWRADGRR